MNSIDSRANDSEFIAEETLVTITSSINHPELKFISGLYGPLEAGLPCQLPLWLAINLRRKGKCAISIPDWLTVDALERVIKQEKIGQALFETMPFNYIEIGYLLLNFAKEDIQTPDKVGALLKDLENIRMDRMKRAIEGMANTVKEGERVYLAKVTNIASMEIFSIQDFVSESLTQFRILASTQEETFNRTSNYRTNGFENQNAVVEESSTRKLRKFRG